MSAAPRTHRCMALALAHVFLAALIAACAGGARGPAGDGQWDDPRREAADRRIMRLIAEERWERVVDAADSVESDAGGDPRLWGQKALALGKTGRFDESVALFEQALLADYASCDNHLNFAVVLLESGRSGRALTELAEASRFCGAVNRPVVQRNRAAAFLHRGERDRALEAVDEGLSSAPKDPYLLGLKGMLIAEAAPVQAESLFVRAEAAGPLPGEFLYQLGLLLLRGERPAEAIGPLEAALRGDPGDRGIRAAFAEALARAGRYDEAEAVLRGLIAEAPDEEIERRLGRLLMRRGEYAEALGIFRSLAQTPENRDRAAMCLHMTGRTREALEIQRGVVAERPDWPTGLVNLAVYLGAEGELEEAEALLVRALELDPENVAATVNLESLRRARESGSPAQDPPPPR
ncbi:MAG: tetratricopeptide repeat protein [Candidatus Krumholzibacteria bacterium]|nr:tetratricopeptide repeat protein [Candidatus Krumholzibacteria bacterium]